AARPAGKHRQASIKPMCWEHLENSNVRYLYAVTCGNVKPWRLSRRPEKLTAPGYVQCPRGRNHRIYTRHSDREGAAVRSRIGPTGNLLLATFISMVNFWAWNVIGPLSA